MITCMDLVRLFDRSRRDSLCIGSLSRHWLATSLLPPESLPPSRLPSRTRSSNLKLRPCDEQEPYLVRFTVLHTTLHPLFHALDPAYEWELEFRRGGDA